MNTSLDVLLIRPQTEHDLVGNPPLGLGFISAAVKRAGYRPRILDCHILGIAPSELPTEVDLSDVTLVGFQAFFMDLPSVREYVDVIRRHAPRLPIIVGGAAPSSDAAYVFRYLEGVDFLCTGEGEETISGLLGLMEQGQLEDVAALEEVPNLCWQEGDQLHRTPHTFVADLDEIGPPDWEELDPTRYPRANLGFFFKHLPALPILTSRGCPFHCSYCGGRLITGYKVRRRSAASLVAEVADLRERYGIREFQIIDDNFTSPPRAATEFCRQLTARGMDLVWSCPTGLRLDTLDRELLEAMKAAGCYEVATGIESGDPDVLCAMNKRTTPEKVARAIRMIDEVGISAVGLIIVGFPGETRESLERTMRFVMDLPLIRVSLTRFIPIRGTPITQRLLDEGELTEEELDPARQTLDGFSYRTPALSERQLVRMYRRFFLRFLLRPRIILHLLQCVRSRTHVEILLERVKLVLFGK